MLSKLGMLAFAVAAACYPKRKIAAAGETDEELPSRILEEPTALSQAEEQTYGKPVNKVPYTLELLREYMRSKPTSEEPQESFEEFRDIMKKVKSLTQPEMDEGFRVSVSAHPPHLGRFTGSWHYAEELGFQTYVAAFNTMHEYARDFIGVEYAMKKGLSLIGTYKIPYDYCPEVLLEGNMADIKKPKEITYSAEVRKIIDRVSVGLIKTNEAICVNVGTCLPNCFVTGQVDYVLLAKKLMFSLGGVYTIGKHLFCATYKGKDNHSINVGYRFDYNPKLSFATEYVYSLGTRKSDAFLGYRVKFLSAEARGGISTSLVVKNEVTHLIDGLTQITIAGEIDFMKKSACKFGLSLDIGSLSIEQS